MEVESEAVRRPAKAICSPSDCMLGDVILAKSWVSCTGERPGAERL